jgi:hypothetical protein
MNRLKYLYRRSVAAIPPVLVAVGCLALWLLWPHGRPGPEWEHPRSGTHIRFAGSVPAFDRPSVVSDLTVIPSSASRKMDDKDDLSILLFTVPGADSREARSAPGSSAAPCWKAPPAERAIRAPGYRPPDDLPPAITNAAAAGSEIALEIAPALRARGFSLPEAPAELLKSATGWEAVFQVEVGADGRVEHVFREAGSGNAGLDAPLLKWLYRGSLAGNEGPCNGRILVNFGAR